MRFGAAELAAILDEYLPKDAAGLVVGVSGGADSACLLSALAELRRFAVRAVHVDHGLQAASVALRASCALLCERLAIPLTVIGVTVESAGESLEAAAREARYRAFAQNLAPGECLLTAHHADDQAETLLLQLLRGAGVKGLSAMPVRRRFAGGWHLRPLLHLTRPDLEAYGRAHGVEAHEDPMNRDARFDRAFLRTEVWPKIIQRWPGAAAALGRAAGHAADAQELLENAADAALFRLRDGAALSVTGLRALAERERVNVLRRWLAATGIVPPSTARLREGLRQTLTADADHVPGVEWGGHALRRYRERVFLTPAAVPSLCARREWPVRLQSRLELGGGLGTLCWVPRKGGLRAGLLPAVLSVRRRSGGESLKPAAHASTQSVQHLCQAMGVLPWMRDALPMIYAGESLIAIGDIWRDARWLAGQGEAGFDVVWEGAPELCCARAGDLAAHGANRDALIVGGGGIWYSELPSNFNYFLLAH
jgi:tRNA(Ile)-lysidine synthase